MRLLVQVRPTGYLVFSFGLSPSKDKFAKICPHCKEDYVLAPSDIAWLSSGTHEQNIDQQSFKKGAGCQHCNNTGYQGRVGVYELLDLDKDMLNALRSNDPSAFVQATLKNPYYRSLGKSALDLASTGVTTLDEVMRIVGELEDEV